MLMPKQFWFLSAGFACVVLVVLWWRLNSATNTVSNNGTVTGRFIGVLFSLCALPAATIGLLQLYGNHTGPTFFLSRTTSDPTIVGAWAVVGIVWVSALWWVWAGDGARSIAAHSHALNVPAKEAAVRLLVTACVLGGAASSLIWTLVGGG